MSVSQQRVRPRRIQTKLVVCVTGLLLYCPWTLAQAGPGKPSQNNFGAARRIIGVFYPELSGRHLSLTYSFSASLDANEEPSTNQFSVLVSRFPPGQEVQIAGYLNRTVSDSKPKDAHMSVGLWFNNSGKLERFTAQGDFSNDDKNKAAHEPVNSHSDWADARISDELEVAGAKFGPNAKQDLMKEVPIDGLSSIIGKSRVVSAEFEFRDSETAGNLAALVWQVQLEAEPEPGVLLRYFLILEPFGAKVLYLQRLSGK